MMELLCWHKRVNKQVVLDTGLIQRRENLMEDQFVGGFTDRIVSIYSPNSEGRALAGPSSAEMKISKITLTRTA